MKMALIFSLGFLASSSLVAQDIQWQVGKCYVSAKAGPSIAADKSTYFFVPVTAKNVAAKEISVRGFDADFELHQGDYVYKNDGGVSWKYVRGFYDVYFPRKNRHEKRLNLLTDLELLYKQKVTSW